MSDLHGRHKVSLDRNGRLAIPAQFRMALPEDQQNAIILTRGFDPCITGYSVDSWEEFESLFYESDMTQKQFDVFEREFIGRKHNSPFDKQGRVTLPPHLFEFAQLKNINEVIVIGTKNRIEIWNPELYKEFRPDQEDVIEEMRTKLKPSRKKSDS